MKTWLFGFARSAALLVALCAPVCLSDDETPNILERVVYFAGPQAGGPAMSQQTLTAHASAKAPDIDGADDDEAWAKAEHATAFQLVDGGGPARAQTYVKVTFDDKHLYVAFECAEPLMDRVLSVSRTRDGRVTEDDCVELLIGNGADRSSFFRWIINPSGAIADERVTYEIVPDVTDGAASGARAIASSDSGWNSSVRLATARTAQSWTVELAIPWADMGLGPASGSVLPVNFRRLRKPIDETSAWASMPQADDGAEVVGILKLSDGPLETQVLSWGPPWAGKNELKLRLANVGKRTLALRVRVTTGSERRLKTFADEKVRVRRGKQKTLTLPYELMRTGEALQRIAVEVFDRKADRVVWKNALKVRPPKPLLLRVSPWVTGEGSSVTCFALCRLGKESLDDSELRLRLVDRSNGVVLGRGRVKDLRSASCAITLGKGVRLSPGAYAIGADLVDSDELAIASEKERVLVVSELDYGF